MFQEFVGALLGATSASEKQREGGQAALGETIARSIPKANSCAVLILSGKSLKNSSKTVKGEGGGDDS